VRHISYVDYHLTLLLDRPVNKSSRVKYIYLIACIQQRHSSNYRRRIQNIHAPTWSAKTEKWNNNYTFLNTIIIMSIGRDYVSALRPPVPVEWHWQGKIPDSSNRALWQSYQQSSTRKAEGNGEYCLTKYLLHTKRGSLTRRKILQHATDGFTLSLKECALRIFIALKNPCILVGFESANLVSNDKHANH
jgi:hypothetical protein